MKKLSLKNIKLNAKELLQKDQLKAVFGGYGGPGCAGITSFCSGPGSYCGPGTTCMPRVCSAGGISTGVWVCA